MPPSRHMKFRSKPVFSWIGETIQPPLKDVRIFCPYARIFVQSESFNTSFSNTK